MWRYHGCHGYFSLSPQEKSVTASRHRCLYNKQNMTCPLVDTNFIWVFNSLSHEWAQRTSEISSWTLEDKIRVHARVCNILNTFLFRNIKTTAVMNQYTVSTRAVRNVFFARTSSHTWRPLASGLWCNVLSVMLVFPNWRRMWVASEQKPQPL